MSARLRVAADLAASLSLCCDTSTARTEGCCGVSTTNGFFSAMTTSGQLAHAVNADADKWYRHRSLPRQHKPAVYFPHLLHSFVLADAEQSVIIAGYQRAQFTLQSSSPADQRPAGWHGHSNPDGRRAPVSALRSPVSALHLPASALHLPVRMRPHVLIVTAVQGLFCP